MNKKISTVNCCLLRRILPTICSNSRKRRNFILSIFQYLFETYQSWVHITQTYVKQNVFTPTVRPLYPSIKRKHQLKFYLQKSSNAKRSYINVNPKNTKDKGQSKNPHPVHHHLRKSRKKGLEWAMKSPS